MVIHRSKFPKNLGHNARGRITSSSDKRFQVSRTKQERDSNGRLVTIRAFQTLENRAYNTYQKPMIHAEVLLRYHDSKSRNLENENPEKNLPFEVLTLRGELLYREDFI